MDKERIVAKSRSYSLIDGLKHIRSLRTQQLRGYETDEDPIDAVDILHEVLQGQVDHMKATKRQLQQGDKNAISDALVSNQVEARELAKFAASAPSFEEEDEDEDEFITNFDFSSMSEDHMDVTELEPFLEHFSAEELASMYMDDEIIDRMQEVVDDLGDVKRGHSPKASKKKKKKKKKSVPSSTFSDKVHVKMPKLKAVQKLRAEYGGGVDHGRRLQVTKQCQSCDEDDYQCNCQRLVDCAKDLTWYDASAMFLGGFVSVLQHISISFKFYAPFSFFCFFSMI